MHSKYILYDIKNIIEAFDKRNYILYNIIMKHNRISAFVKEQRKKHGLTQEQCALYAGVGLAFLRALEQGKTTLKVENVNKVLNLFNAELGPVEVPRQ